MSLFVLSLVAASPLFADGWFDTHEATDPLERVIATSTEIEHGQLYPRWLSSAYGGRGSPFPNYYSPGYYLGASYLHVLGLPLIAAMKTLTWALFLIGAAGVWLWMRPRLGREGALLAAILYLFAPYHFVDVYVRGAMAEFAALAFLPWLFLGIDLSFAPDQRRGVIATAAASAAIVLCHNLSAIMIALFAAPYFALAARGGARRRVAVACLGPVLGAGLSAFYWLPVLMERGALRGVDQLVTAGYYAVDQHFVLPGQLLSTMWGFGPSVPGPDDGMSFQIGLAIVAFAAVGVAVKEDRRYTLLLLGLGVAGVLLTTAALGFVYKVVPGLALVQFPWRFLGPAGLFLSALGGRAARLRPAWGWALVGVAAVAVIALSWPQRTVQSVPDTARLNRPEVRAALLERRMIGSLTQVDEYLPKGALLTGPKQPLSGLPGPSAEGAAISGLEVRGSSQRFRVESAAGATLSIPWFWFPGWKAELDGGGLEVAADPAGFIALKVPPGAHEVRVWFGTTAPRTAGWLIAAATLTLLVALRKASWLLCEGRGA